MDELLNRFAASEMNARMVQVLLALAITVLVVCVAIVGWQVYQLTDAAQRIVDHMLFGAR